MSEFRREVDRVAASRHAETYRPRLAGVYTDEGIDIWIDSPNRHLGGMSPWYLLLHGDFAAVDAEVSRLEAL